MNTQDYISSLPQPEQKALAVCGIYKEQQLTRVPLQTLIAEMEQAAQFFPDDITPLSPERLAAIYQQVVHNLDTAEAQIELEQVVEEEATPNAEDDENMFAGTLPTLELRHHSGRKRRTASTRYIDLTKRDESNATDLQIFHKENAIYNTRPVRTYFSAFFFILMVLCLITFVVMSARLLMRIDEEVNYIVLALLLVFAIFPYFMYTAKTRCPVCNMNIFSLRNYTRNSHAHYFPLLGFTLSTAMHIFFLFWFRCPACGTSQKIAKRKKN